jgi:hypothetical protein
MNTTSYEPPIGLTTSNRVRLTRLERWWANSLPPVIKRVLPPWPISAGLVTLMTLISADPMLTTMMMLFWASLSFAWLFRKFNHQIGHFRWMIPAYHAGLFLLIGGPAMAQSSGAACSSPGLFSQVTNFINTLFASISFGGVGGGTLANLICQVVGFLTIAILLGFLAVIGFVAFQIGYQRQPISTVLDPLMGFLIFAGGATIMIAVMVGGSGVA